MGRALEITTSSGKALKLTTIARAEPSKVKNPRNLQLAQAKALETYNYSSGKALDLSR